MYGIDLALSNDNTFLKNDFPVLFKSKKFDREKNVTFFSTNQRKQSHLFSLEYASEGEEHLSRCHRCNVRV